MRRIQILLIWSLRAAGLAAALWAAHFGLGMRDRIWTWSTPIRFGGDISNALEQGGAVVDDASAIAIAEGKSLTVQQLSTPLLLRAYLKRYDAVIERADDENYKLDYTPARLLVMTFWARHVRGVDPEGQRVAQEDALPLLRFNTACEATAAIFMFLLVRLWVHRSRGTMDEWGWILGLVAALVSWFNPSTLLDAHIWPQWDVWLVPFYLAAMYLASIEWWFAAGMSIAVGAMFKGQLLLVAPVLVLWPVFGGRLPAAARILIGFLFATGLIVSPWLAPSAQAWQWICAVNLLCIALVVIGRNRPARIRPGRRIWPIWGVIPIIALAALPCGLTQPTWLMLAGAVVCTPWIAGHLTRTGSGVWLAAIATGSLCICASAFAGSWSWFTIGFAYGTHHYRSMADNGGINLAAVLGDNYHWQIEDVVGHLRGWEITMKKLLVTIYAVALVLCAAGAAMHQHKRDARTLIALTAPWVLMFALLPQMHERYLMWAAAVCGVAAASSVGVSLMHLIVIGLSLSIIARDMRIPRDFSPFMSTFESGISPGLGWMVLLAAAVYLFVAIMPRRSRKSPAMAGGLQAIDFRADRSYAWDHANQASEAPGPASPVCDDPK